MINNGKATSTSASTRPQTAHWSLYGACLMKRMQMAGNKPIALIGGGTAMIGDPSGRYRYALDDDRRDHPAQL